MDHLNLDINRTEFSPENKGDAYQAQCAFEHFPARAGWMLDTATGRLTVKEIDSVAWPALKFPILMQSWLFFGLITAVVYDDNNLDNRKFLAADFDDHGSITTKKLPNILKSWQDWEITQKGYPGQKMRMIRAQLALDLARKVVKMYCSAENLELEGQYMGQAHLDSKLALSLMVIGETLSNAKAKIIAQIGFDVRGWYGDATIGWGLPLAVIKAMKEDDWCPRTVELLKTQLRKSATGFLSAYASHSRRHFKGHELAKCKPNLPCKVKSQRGKDYVTKHHPDCLHNSYCHHLDDKSPVPINEHGCVSCIRNSDIGAMETSATQITCHTPCDEMVGPMITDVLKLINEGKIPLVKFKPDTLSGKLELEVTDNTREAEYATVSHVWADGYGNTKSNALYRCQLEYLKRLLKEAQFQRNRYKRGYQKERNKVLPLPFWMDTLLIPVADKHKVDRKKAILQIYAVFSKAKYTIVIDNGLNNMTWNDKDYTTTAMRILASGWMRRLWTLQEAYLSRKILFAFKSWEEGAATELPLVDLDEIEALYDDGEKSLMTDLPSLARSYYDNLLGDDRKTRNNKSVPTNGMSLVASVWRAAQWRTTSHSEHETLAIATLLNLDLSKKSFGEVDLMKRDDKESGRKLDEMMRDFWLALNESSPGAIPPGIIFLPGDRIQISGFGWAPKSWMSAQGVDRPDPIAVVAKAAALSPELGLQVEFPGFLLHCEDRNAILGVTDDKGFRFPIDNSLTEYYHAKWADEKEYGPKRGVVDGYRSEELAIILCRPRPGQEAEIGLLVEIHDVKQEKKDLGQDSVRRVFAVYMLRRVHVKRETAESSLAARMTILMNRDPNEQPKIICGEILDEDQKWFVDCRTPPKELELAASARTVPDLPRSPTAGRSTVMGLRGATESRVQLASDRATRTTTQQHDHADPPLAQNTWQRSNGDASSSPPVASGPQVPSTSQTNSNWQAPSRTYGSQQVPVSSKVPSNPQASSTSIAPLASQAPANSSTLAQTQEQPRPLDRAFDVYGEEEVPSLGISRSNTGWSKVFWNPWRSARP